MRHPLERPTLQFAGSGSPRLWGHIQIACNKLSRSVKKYTTLQHILEVALSRYGDTRLEDLNQHDRKSMGMVAGTIARDLGLYVEPQTYVNGHKVRKVWKSREDCESYFYQLNKQAGHRRRGFKASWEREQFDKLDHDTNHLGY